MFKVKQASKVKRKAWLSRKLTYKGIIFHNKARDTKHVCHAICCKAKHRQGDRQLAIFASLSMKSTCAQRQAASRAIALLVILPPQRKQCSKGGY